MSRISFSVMLVFLVAFATVEHVLEAQHTSSDTNRRLGPDPLVYVPADLAETVQRAEAAVVADIVGFGPLELRTTTSTGGTPLGTEGLARYKVRIKDVLYNRKGDSAPSLATNGVSDLLFVVGREGAQAFEAKQTRVQEGDECVLFLWHRPGADSWSLAPWQLQFRKSQVAERSAEPVLPKRPMTWLGGSLAVTREGDRETVDWAALIAEIRKLANSKIE